MKKSYTVPCTQTNECDDTAGLICPSTTGTCNCPVASSTIFCDCPVGYFYDYTNNTCGNELYSYLQLIKTYLKLFIFVAPALINSLNCTNDYQCKTSSSLTCQNGTCKCPSAPGWYFYFVQNRYLSFINMYFI